MLLRCICSESFPFYSVISSNTLLGNPGEVYTFGTIFVYRVIAMPVGLWIAYKVFLPVFLRVGTPSIYQVPVQLYMFHFQCYYM